ncbi:MAG: Radical domain protein [Eubacterium sp.]|jgi:spore photoproduct lyase|nr:Radical domain protein [Eubacterium sp.]
MFVPQRVIFETGALEYPLGKQLHSGFKAKGIEIIESSINKVKSNIPGETPAELYKSGKATLVVGAKKSLTFQSCKPSAHYQLPLVSGCIGQCEYCYLNTQLGDKPFIRVHVNLEDIFHQADKYIKGRLPEETIFEGSATSDPVPVEPYTGALKKAINYFAVQPDARFRFVTKFTDIDDLLNLEHKNKTEIRFSLNTESIIQAYEHKTASAKKRIEASSKLYAADYPIGFIIAPVFIYEGWEKEYKELLAGLREAFPAKASRPVTFEVISHRYTTKAKNTITEIFPETTLDMENEKRQFKYGQFGYGKYVYPKETLGQVKEFFQQEIAATFENGVIKYII